MKTMRKKIGFAFAAVLVLTLSQVIMSFAASGSLYFTDPDTAAGEQVTVQAVADASGQAIGDVDATLSYDPNMLEFVSGTNASGGGGVINLSASGTGAETSLSFDIVFNALTEGTTTVEVTASTAFLFSGEALDLTWGNSTVTIAEGDESTKSSGTAAGGNDIIEMAGTQYTVYNNFSDALVLDGFSRSVTTYGSSEYNTITQDSTGKIFFYLVTGDNDPVLAYYTQSDNSFVPGEQVYVLDDFYVIVLGMGDDSDLPYQFGATTMDLNGTIFPAWQNTEEPDYYLIYALSSDGNEGFYQYDTEEGTYQRYTIPSGEEEAENEAEGLLGRLKDFINDHFLVVLAAVFILILILIIIIIIQSVRVGRRNSELDDLYDQEEQREAAQNPAPRQNQNINQNQDYDDYDDDDFDDDDYDDDDFDGGDDDGGDDDNFDIDFIDL